MYINQITNWHSIDCSCILSNAGKVDLKLRSPDLKIIFLRNSTIYWFVPELQYVSDSLFIVFAMIIPKWCLPLSEKMKILYMMSWNFFLNFTSSLNLKLTSHMSSYLLRSITGYHWRLNILNQIKYMWTFWQASIVNPSTALVMILNKLAIIHQLGKTIEKFQSYFPPNLSPTRSATTVFFKFINMKFSHLFFIIFIILKQSTKSLYDDDETEKSCGDCLWKQRQQKKTR